MSCSVSLPNALLSQTSIGWCFAGLCGLAPKAFDALKILKPETVIRWHRAYALRFSTSHPEIKVLSVELPMARVPNGIITLKDRTLSPVAQLFIENAREVATPLTKQK